MGNRVKYCIWQQHSHGITSLVLEQAGYQLLVPWDPSLIRMNWVILQ